AARFPLHRAQPLLGHAPSVTRLRCGPFEGEVQEVVVIATEPVVARQAGRDGDEVGRPWLPEQSLRRNGIVRFFRVGLAIDAHLHVLPHRPGPRPAASGEAECYGKLLRLAARCAPSFRVRPSITFTSSGRIVTFRPTRAWESPVFFR